MLGTIRSGRVLIFTVLLLLWNGCSDLNEKIKAMTEPPQPVNPADNIKNKLNSNLSDAEKLLAANEGKGKSVITGVLKQEGTLSALSSQGLKKVVTNAQGTSRTSSKEFVPLKDALVLFYDALNPSSTPEYETKTDTSGRYNAVVSEGQYFAFAVKFDPIKLQLITARLDNIQAKEDTVIEIEETAASEDKISPTVLSIYNAMAPDENNIFLLSGIPNKETKINITFSEPINRNLDTLIQLGALDTSSTAFNLTKILSASQLVKTWSGDNTVLTLSFKNTELVLDTNVQYGISIPTTIKDLANNSLDAAYKATFIPVQSNQKNEFVLASSLPLDGDSLRPSQRPTLLFNEPVNVFSALRGIKISPTVDGVWDVMGTRVVFRPKSPLSAGSTYQMSIDTGVQSISGLKLAKGQKISFKIGVLSGLAAGTSAKSSVARIVNEMIDAYKQGDIPKFASFFHENLRFEGNRSKAEFLNMIRSEVDLKNTLSAGYMAPVFDTSVGCIDSGKISRWKVRSADQPNKPILWVETHVPPGLARRVWLAEANPVLIENSKIKWVPFRPELEYDGARYIYDADFSRFSGATNQANMQNDFRFYNDLIRQSSSVLLENVSLKATEEMTLDENLVLNGDTAMAVMKNRSMEKASRSNFDRECKKSTDEKTSIISLVLLKTGEQWKIIHISSEDVDKKEFQQNVQYDQTFQKFNDQQKAPLALLRPVSNDEVQLPATGDSAAVTFKFARQDSAGGYIIGMAEDPKYVSNRGKYGLLIFVKNTSSGEVSFKLNRKAQLPSGSSANRILRNPRDLALPGWDRCFFDQQLEELVNYTNGLGGIYIWKAIAVKDTSAAQFLANGFKFERFLGESDFYRGVEYGRFAVTHFPDQIEMEQIFRNQRPSQQGPINGGSNPPMQNSFNDLDRDGYPDFIEQKYKTDPRNPSSYPEFSLDTDRDGLPDFLEQMIMVKKGLKDDLTDLFDSNLTQSLKYVADSLGIIIIDDDKDGFPNDIEELLGFNPRDPQNKPGLMLRPTLPTGDFKGRMQMGPEQFDFTASLIKVGSNDVYVKYKMVLRGDTLSDSVRSLFTMNTGEFLFPIRITSGPNSGQSYLLRGHYDNLSSVLKGGTELIPSQPINSNQFPGGPFVGQFVAGSKADFKAENYMGQMGPANPNQPYTGPNTPIGPVNPQPIKDYRNPPAGAGETWNFEFRSQNGQPELILMERTDTLVHFYRYGKAYGIGKEWGRMDIFMQPDGSYMVNAEWGLDSAWRGEKIIINGRLLKGRAGTTPAWVFDGTLHEENRRCSKFDANSNCISSVFEPKDGDFSSKIDLEKLSFDGSNPKGTLMGWIKKQEFFNTAPYLGTPLQFQSWLDQKGISYGSEFLIKAIPGERVYTVKYDTTLVTRAYQPECMANPGFIRLFPTNDTENRFTQRPTGPTTGPASQLILMEIRPGEPNYQDNLKDEKGENLGKGGFIVQERGLIGPVCPAQGGNTTPINPIGPIVQNDRDGDCIDDQFDPNPFDKNVPQYGGRCGTNNAGMVMYAGDTVQVKSALTATGGNAWIREPNGALINVNINPGLYFDPNRKHLVLKDNSTGKLFALLAPPADRLKLELKDNKPILIIIDTMQAPMGQDKDGDCIFTPNDPDDNNRDIPKVGGSCQNTNPTQPSDKDGDCIFTPNDPDDNNRDIPKVGGSCQNTNPIQPNLYIGKAEDLKNELQTKNLLDKVNVSGEIIEIHYVLAIDIPKMGTATPPPLYTASKGFGEMYNKGPAPAPIAVKITHNALTREFVLLKNSEGALGEPLINNRKLMFVESLP